MPPPAPAEPPPPRHAPTGWRRLCRRLFDAIQQGGAVLGLCCLVVLWGGVLHALSAERQQALRGATEDAANLSRAFEEHIIRSIKAVDQTLLYVRDAYVRNPAGFEIAAWARSTRFLTDLTFQISLTDRSGIMIGSSLSPVGTHIDLSDREHFRVHLDNPADTLFISKPVLGRASGKWSIQLTRKIIGPDGGFDGVVVVSLDPGYLSRFYDSVDLGARGSIALVGTDGLVRVRAAAGTADSGQSLAGSVLLRAYAAAPAGSFAASGLIDPVRRIYAYRAVRGYPLIVCVGIAEDEALANFQANAHADLAVASALTLLLVIVTATIMHRDARLRRTREDLRASEARYVQKSTLLEAAVENVSQGIMMSGRDGTLLVCNRQAIDQLHLPPDLRDDPLADPLADPAADPLADPPNDPPASAGARYELRQPDGTLLDIQCTPLADGGVVRTITDITDQRQYETALRTARDQAHQAARAKSEFLAMMSHEIRSPMNGLLGIVELLRDTPLNDDQANMVALAHESAASLLGIVNDVLDFSRIDAGRVEIAAEPTPLRELVRGLVEAAALPAARRGLSVVHRVAEDLPDWIATDPLRLRQILGNLLGNAVKFTASGRVELAVQRATVPNGRDDLVFAVSDTGIGMSEAVLQRLFEPFVQADASTTKTFGGSGLGLSISRRLARLLGGDITVRSAEGRGSVFTLVVPLVPAAEPAPAPAADTVAPDAWRGLRVLVAEDQQTNRWLIDRQFGRLGVAAVLVEDGHQALAALGHGAFDLLITDCHMPGMDGVELATRIRRTEAASGRPRLPIIGLTADVTAGMRAQCLEAGMDDVASKPIDLRRLAQTLRRILPNLAGAMPFASAAHPAGSVASGSRSLGPSGSDPAGQAPPAPTPAGFADAAAPPVFDDQFFLELFADAEAEGAAWFGAYLETTAATLEPLRQACATADRSAVASLAHRMAGNALSAGATRLGMAARALEQAAAVAPASVLRAAAHGIVADFAAAQVEINRFIAAKLETVP
jgi:signal transduction histidine kinase/HPt (histidine-containing phosphotransfer) domain-containing protein/ActR/RegA family two-component response regulator